MISMTLKDVLMARPATSSPDGKRDHEVKTWFTESEYDDLCALARLMRKSKSELMRDLFHIQAYGLLGIGGFSPSVDVSKGPE